MPLLVVTRPHKIEVSAPNIGTSTIPAGVVVGVELPTGQFSKVHGRLSAQDEETELDIPLDEAERVYNFFDVLLSEDARGPGGWQCHSFLAYVKRWSNSMHQVVDPISVAKAAPDSLEDGAAYGIVQPSGDTIYHSMLGNLSVAGRGGDLILADGLDLLYAYGGPGGRILELAQHHAPHPKAEHNQPQGLTAPL